MRIYLILVALFIASPALAAPKYATTSSAGHQPVKAAVKDADPAHYTINLMSLSNVSVNKKAPTYVLYTRGKLPKTCGDFRKDDVRYKKPDKFTRVFDLSGKPYVLDALKELGCVVILNKPKLPPAAS